MKINFKNRFDQVSKLYIFSISIALIDYLTFSRPKDGAYSFETFCMRIVVIFSYLLLFRVVTNYLKAHGLSDLKAKAVALISIPTLTLILAFLIPKF